MARKRVNTTKYEIIRQGTKLILEKGFSAATPKLLCERLNISTGNLTYYFPTKEHLLAELIEMHCKFQENTVQYMVQEEGATSLLAACLEVASMAAMSEACMLTKDLLLAAYSSPMCLNIIRDNDARRSKQIYHTFCSDWTDQQYIEAEILVSGIRFATLMTTHDSVPLESRIAGALNSIMQIYNVPEDIRKQTIDKVLAMDYRALGMKVLDQFREFVEKTNEQTLDALLK